MAYQRTQIYLDADDHRRLRDEAHRRGLSLAALLREIVRERLAPRPPPDLAGFDALIGIVDSGEPTDVARHEDDYKADALDARYRKKMGDASHGSTPRGRGARRKAP